MPSHDPSGRDEPIDEVPIPEKGSLLLGKYRVEAIVGFGGMGVVLSARHELLGDRIAMKLLLPTHAKNPETRARFTREAQAAFLLKSEHVCRVLDAGELEDGTPFIAMEYLKGEDVGARIRRLGKLPVEQACEIVLQACDAMAEAHANDIVHRDLKPSNLVVVKRKDGSSCVKVIDFGISKLGVSRVVEATTSPTKTFAYLGSPIYSAPEHLEAARAATARSDQWSLAVVLYQSLTAQMPFEFTDDAVWAVTAVVQKAAPIPMRARDPSIPAPLDAAVLRCLEKDPQRRFPNVQAFAREIAPFAGPSARDILARVSAHALLDDEETVALAGKDLGLPGPKDARVTMSKAPPRPPHFSPTPLVPPTPMPLAPTRMYSAPPTPTPPRPSGAVPAPAPPSDAFPAGIRIAFGVLALASAAIAGAVFATRNARPNAPAPTVTSAAGPATASAPPASSATESPAVSTSVESTPSVTSAAPVASASAKTRVRTKATATPAGSGPTFLKNRNGE